MAIVALAQLTDFGVGTHIIKPQDGVFTAGDDQVSLRAVDSLWRLEVCQYCCGNLRSLNIEHLQGVVVDAAGH